MKKILDALESLCRAWPEAEGIAVRLICDRAHFTVQCKTEEAVYALAAEYDVTVKRETSDNSTWLAAYGQTTFYGPHRDIVPESKVDVRSADAASVDAALAQAAEAVQS